MSGEYWLHWEQVDQYGDIYTARTGHAVISYGGSLYLFGGIDETDRQNDMIQYKISCENSWSKLKTQGELPSARSGSIGLQFNNQFYFFGGYTRKHGEYYNDLFIFNPLNNQWVKANLKGAPLARIDHSFCRQTNQQGGSPKIGNGLCFLYGGSNGVKKLSDLFELSLEKLEWRQIQQEGAWPSGRFGHTAAIEGECMYLFGGWDGTNTLNDLWAYNIKSSKWLYIDAQNPPASRYRHSALVYNKCMYVFGGVDQNQERFGDLHEYGFGSNIWRRIVLSKGGPSPRSFHKSVYDEGYMYVVGGYDGQRRNDLYRINLELVQVQSDAENIKKVQSAQEKKPEIVLLSLVNQEQSVKEYQSMLKTIVGQQVTKARSKNLIKVLQQFPMNRWFYSEQDLPRIYTPRTGHAAVCLGDVVYLFSGIDIDGNRNNDLYALDINENTWKKLNPEGQVPASRSGSKAIAVMDYSKAGSPKMLQQKAVKGGQIVIFGGYIQKDTQHCNDLMSYDIVKNQWSTIQPSTDEMPFKRTDHTMVRYGKFIYIFGGRGENKQIYNDLKRFNLNKKVWKDIKGEGAQIVPRFGHVAVTFEHSMYLFGGWDGMNCLDDLFQYSYVTNIWYELRRCVGEVKILKLIFLKKPSPRYRHDSLAYQDNMYIFGGVDQNQKRFNDLFQFNFKKRQWTNVITSGCLPSPRTFHKIVNHENLIFLLGGFDGDRRNDLHMIKVEVQQIVEEDPPAQDFSISFIQSNNTTVNNNALIKMLNEQVKELSKKIQREEDKNLCKICFSREIDTVLMECCHFILCFNCTTNLKNCPICRSNITRVIKTTLY